MKSGNSEKCLSWHRPTNSQMRLKSKGRYQWTQLINLQPIRATKRILHSKRASKRDTELSDLRTLELVRFQAGKKNGHKQSLYYSYMKMCF